MPQKEKTVLNLLHLCEQYNLAGVDFLHSLSLKELCFAYNGLGPDWFPPKLRKAVDKLDPVLRPIALPHDCRFTFGDGSREWFDKANDELESNGLKIANSTYRWYNPMRYITRYRARTYAALCRTLGWGPYCIASSHPSTHCNIGIS